LNESNELIFVKELYAANFGMRMPKPAANMTAKAKLIRREQK
jgi:hypothetical protein